MIQCFGKKKKWVNYSGKTFTCFVPESTFLNKSVEMNYSMTQWLSKLVTYCFSLMNESVLVSKSIEWFKWLTHKDSFVVLFCGNDRLTVHLSLTFWSLSLHNQIFHPWSQWTTWKKKQLLTQFLVNVDLISAVNIDHGHLQGELRLAECSLYTGETHNPSSENCHGMWFVTNTVIVRACASLTFIMSENLGNLLMLFWRTAMGLTNCQDFNRSPLSDITIHLPPLSPLLASPAISRALTLLSHW